KAPEEPVLSKDHSLDWSAEDIINWERPIEIKPELVRLAAELRGMSPARRVTLAASPSPNGWPARWHQWIDRTGGWVAFKSMAEEALSNFEDGIPVESTLAVIEHDRETHGFTT